MSAGFTKVTKDGRRIITGVVTDVVTDVDAGVPEYVVRWEGGSISREWRLGVVMTPLDREETKELEGLIAAQIRAEQAVQRFERAHLMDVPAAVQEALRA
jgi:hypothetical protein